MSNDENEPTKEELAQRVDQLEQTVQKMMPNRRQALKGMARTLSEESPRVIWVECHDGTASEVQSLLDSHSYDVETAHNDGERYLRGRR